MEHETSGQSSLHISDVIEVIQTTDPEFADDQYRRLYSLPGEEEKRKAYVEITEQPAPKALRFRYECEGRSAGSIPGASSSPDNRTYPSIRVVGYTGRAVVVVSCVTREAPHRPHPHSLVGKEGCKRGVCTLELAPDMTASFPGLGIQCVKKRDVEEALRAREEIRVDPFRTGFAHRTQPSSLDLNSLRLCFQVFLEGSDRGKFTFQLTPAVSDPIYDKKAMSDLVICKLSDCSASVAGGKEIILLCEKVAKEDIQVRFFEPGSTGQVLWEAQGDFTPAQVHKQVAIALRTPRYRTLQVERPVEARVQLRRPSDGAASEPLPFQLLPLDSGRAWLRRKGKGDYGTFSSILASHTALLTGGPAPAAAPAPQTKDENANDMQQSADTNLPEAKPAPAEDSEVQREAVAPDPLTDSLLEQLRSEEGLRAAADLTEACQSITELLSHVTDLPGPGPGAVTAMDVDSAALYDEDVYSSLQLAMKNPLQLLDDLASEKYEDVLTVPITAQGPVISIVPPGKREPPPTPTTPVDAKLPPLPPKRSRRSPPPVPPAPPGKILPPPPADAPPKQPKSPGIFSKLFSKKSSKGKKESATPRGSISLASEAATATPRGSVCEIPAELTEAEHYALYTDMAPRATASEFDEASFYYSPVEGGPLGVKQRVGGEQNVEAL